MTLEGYRVLDGGVLIALDGVWYFSPENIHCDYCPHKSEDRATTWYHSIMAERVRKAWNGRHHLEYRRRWINGVEIRDHKETLLVNYLDFQMWNEEKGEGHVS